MSSTVSAFDFISNFRLDTNGVSGVRRTRGSNQYQTAYKISPDADVRISTRCARRLQTSQLIKQIIIAYISSCRWIKTTDSASAFFRHVCSCFGVEQCVWVLAHVCGWFRVVPLVESPVFGHVISNLHRQITLQVKFPQCCTSTCYHVHLPSNLCDLVTDSATTTTAAAGSCWQL